MVRPKHLLEALPVHLLDAALRAMPRGAAISIGRSIGRLARHAIPRRHALIMRNLAAAFPEKSGEERERIARAVWDNLGRTMAEFVRMPDINHANYEQFISYDGEENFLRARDLGKGVVFAGFHFANWEMAGIAQQLRFGDVTAIARPMKNPLVEAWVQGKRGRSGLDIILHRQAVRASFRVLKNRRVIAVLADQNLYSGGVFVDFFGRPAATTTLPALLHIRTGAPVLLVYARRDGDRFRMTYEKPFEFPAVADAEERVRVYTQVITSGMEAVIRRYPDSWFWIHNRWKRAAEAFRS